MLRGRVDLVVTVRCLLAADSVMWAVFGVALWTGLVSVGDVGPVVVSVLSALMLANAVALGLFGWQVLRGRTIVDHAAVVLMAVNAVLSLADEVGVADLLVFALNVVILTVLVVAIRSGAGSPSESGPAPPD